MALRTVCRVVVLAGALLLAVPEARGQRPATATPPSTLTQAKISKEAAAMTATRAVPGSRLQTIGLGMVAGKLAYTAFVTAAGKPRTMVVVDANTGAVLSRRP
ncbi:MAG: PepSY domain-containing protein [Gemmatimonadaceae bacterium]|nr:PepSY domain-containing protein [Gemmatimonadaceae bacterium]